MAVTGIAIGLTVASLALGGVFAFLQSRNGNTDNLQDQGLSEFNPPTVREGTTIPLVYGRNRITPNIIHTGNFVTVENKEDAPAGKGGGSQEVTTGFTSFADIWFGLPMGQIAINFTYVNDKVDTLSFTEQIFNDGTSADFPNVSEFASKLSGQAHIFYRRLKLGENSTSVPAIQYDSTRTLSTPVNHQNMTNGSNPAAIVYDLIIISGGTADKIDLPSFNTAAGIWNAKGYGLNLEIKSQNKLGTIVNRILNYVDGTVFEGASGKIFIRALDPSDTHAATINQDEILSIALDRKTWAQVPNDFFVTYTDISQSFSTRSFRIFNPAAIRLAGRRISQNIDLKAFGDLESATKRATEIAKRESYPGLNIKIETSLKYSIYPVGTILRISHSQLGIVNGDFRITRTELPNIDSQKISIDLEQVKETLFDDNFVAVAGTSVVPIDTAPLPLDNIRIFEMPFNPITQKNPAFLMLCARRKLIETSFLAYVSDNQNDDFNVFGDFSTFAQHGELAAAYPITNTIDDDRGLLYTPTIEDPEFDTVSEEQLFTQLRYALVNDEIMQFRTVTDESSNIRLLGVVRGMFGTEISSHTSGDEIWLFNFANNVLKGVLFERFYVKIAPRFQGQLVSLADVTAILVDKENKALTPRDPAHIYATRLGSNISFDIRPNTPGVRGIGDMNLDLALQPKPYAFEGLFKISWSINEEIKESLEFTINESSSHTFTIKSVVDGIESPGKQITIGLADGGYEA